MTKEEVQQLYKEKILPESKNAYHFEENDEAELILEAYNPMCGDKYKLYFDFEDEKVRSVHFHGFGCAVSKASTSLLARELEGKEKVEVRGIVSSFLQALKEKDHTQTSNDNLKILIELMNFDGRQDCIELSWKALEKELNED